VIAERGVVDCRSEIVELAVEEVGVADLGL